MLSVPVALSENKPLILRGKLLAFLSQKVAFFGAESLNPRICMVLLERIRLASKEWQSQQ